MAQNRSERRGRRRRGFMIGGFMLIIFLTMTGWAIAEHAGIEAKKAVDPTLASYTPVGNLSGRLTITGSDTMQPLLTKLAAAFSLQYPDSKIAVEGGGSSAAIREFIIGYSGQRRGEKSRTGHDGASQAAILASSRELTPAELRAFSSRYGYEPLVVPIAMDAVAIYVNGSNPLQGLTVEQVDAIFSTTRKRGLPSDITLWGQVGLQDGWEKQSIHLYGRDKNSGTHDFFVEAALNAGTLKPEINERPGSAQEILEIARDPLAIGYAGIGFQTSMVRVVPLASRTGTPFVGPSVETVTSGAYPLSRPLYLYVNQAPNSKFDPLLLEFLKYVNSRQGQETVVHAKAYPLPAAVIAGNLNLLSGATVTAAAR